MKRTIKVWSSAAAFVLAGTTVMAGIGVASASTSSNSHLSITHGRLATHTSSGTTIQVTWKEPAGATLSGSSITWPQTLVGKGDVPGDCGTDIYQVDTYNYNSTDNVGNGESSKTYVDHLLSVGVLQKPGSPFGQADSPVLVSYKFESSKSGKACTPPPTPTPTVTVTVPVPGPTVTTTVTATPKPAPTVTVSVPVPGPTVTTTIPVPGPTVTDSVPVPGPTVTATTTVTASPSPAPTVTVTATPKPKPPVIIVVHPKQPRASFQGPCGDPFYRARLVNPTKHTVTFRFSYTSFKTGKHAVIVRRVGAGKTAHTRYVHVLGSHEIMIKDGKGDILDAGLAAAPGDYKVCRA